MLYVGCCCCKPARSDAKCLQPQQPVASPGLWPPTGSNHSPLLLTRAASSDMVTSTTLQGSTPRKHHLAICRAGRERCFRVRWSPLSQDQAAAAEGANPQADFAFRKDANDVLLSDGKEALLQCIEAAEPYPIRGLFRWATWQPWRAMWGETRWQAVQPQVVAVAAGGTRAGADANLPVLVLVSCLLTAACARRWNNNLCTGRTAGSQSSALRCGPTSTWTSAMSWACPQGGPAWMRCTG